MNRILNFCPVFTNTSNPRIFRSAHLDNASMEDLEALRNLYKIKTIIDLRGENESISSQYSNDQKKVTDYYYNNGDNRLIKIDVSRNTKKVVLAGTSYYVLL